MRKLLATLALVLAPSLVLANGSANQDWHYQMMGDWGGGYFMSVVWLITVLLIWTLLIMAILALWRWMNRKK